VRRVLKPDGVAIVTTPFLIPVHTGPGWDDYTRWTPQGLEAVLRRCGFGASVRTWGNLEAARAVMENITISAEEAMRRGVSLTHCDGWFPITVWAIATANKDQPTTPHDRRVPDVRVRNRSTQQVEKVS
jgi:hypothetical protein